MRLHSYGKCPTESARKAASVGHLLWLCNNENQREPITKPIKGR